MKKIVLTLVAIVSVFALSAQYYYVPYPSVGMNPGNLNNDAEYPVGGGISTGWTNILAGHQASAAWSAQKTIPFTFNFNGTDMTNYYVSSSGVLTFSSTVGSAPVYGNAVLPDSTIPDNSVCIRGIYTAGNNSSYANVVTKTFGTTGSRQHWITFGAYNEPNLGSAGFMWLSIVLEEGTNKIYIVDQRKYPTTSTKLTVGIQIDKSTAYSIAGSPNVNMAATSANTMEDNSYYAFIPGVQPSYDVEGVSNTMPDYLALTQLPFFVKSVFKNVGSTSLTSCDINYSINNGAVVSAPATINIAKNGTATVNSSTNWVPSVAGDYKVTVWLSNLNGNADEEGMNDSATKTIKVVDDYAVRIPLCEVFTSSTCGPCVAGNRNTDENIFPLYPNQFSVIKYQMSWPGTGDPYTTAEGNTRRTLYGVNSIPNMQVDGGWNGNAASFTTTLFDQFKAKPAFIKIDAKCTINFKKVSVDVKLTPLSDFNNANMKLFVAVLEKKTTKNIKTNGETEFHHVLKKMLPNANGTNIGSLAKNVDKTFTTFTYNVPGEYRLPNDGQNGNIINLTTENSIEELTDCEVVVFIQDLVTKEVYQSANADVTILSVDDVNATENSLNVYPNPSNGTVTNVNFSLNNTEGVNVNVYNALGQIVETINTSELVNGMNNLKINTSNYNTGIYTVKVEGNGFSVSQKFIVQ
jgi:hypothetical protein